MVRRHVQDEGETAWLDVTILEAVDEVLQDIATAIRQVNHDYDLFKIELAPATDLTELERLLYFYRLPEYVQSLRMLEGRRNGILKPTPIPYVPLTHRDVGRSYQAVPTWTFGEGNHQGGIQLAGRMTGFDAIVIWFIRRYAELHYGVAEGGSTSTIVFDTSTNIGPVVERDDVYVGLEVLINSGNADGDLRVITDYDGATHTATVTPNFSGAVGLGDSYDLVPPISPEFNHYLIHRTAFELILRSGNDRWIELERPHMNGLEQRFTAAIETRIQDEPKRMWTTRTAEGG